MPSALSFFIYIIREHSYSNEPNARFARRFLEAEHQILPALLHRYLSTTKNCAERQIRPAVVNRKISAGNKTLLGAATAQTLMSIVASCRQQFTEAVDVFTQIIRSSGQPVPFWNSA